jgi:predicted ATPase/class 3 adenylate cyclase
METRVSFGNWVQQQRKALDLTQQMLAAQVDCSPVVIQEIEQNERRPSRQIAERLAAVLGLPASQHDLFIEAALGTQSVEQLSPTQRRQADSAYPSGTVTFLFTDIEASTVLWESVPEQMKTALQRHHTILEEAISSQGGSVFLIVGDAFCAAFPGAPSAISAAIHAQRNLFHEQWDLPFPIQVRMGIHTGEGEPLSSRSNRQAYASNPTMNRVARIMQAGHGGQVLLSLATQKLIEDSLPADTRLLDLGEHQLKGINRPEHLFQLQITGLPSEFPALNTLTRRHNLPLPLTEFIGRTAQVAALKELLLDPQARLITLLGPGGSGKTRLSLQVGQQMLDQFPDGVCFVPLADDTDADKLVSRLAQQLEVREGGRPLLENTKDYLRDKRILLILDNFEQLVSAAPIVAGLLAEAPQIKILTSSRIPLKLQGEREFPVPPLDLPQSIDTLPLEELAKNEAVHLFLERAGAVQARFGLTRENAAAVAEICRRLDGLPLAIELAAARIKLLSPQAILTRMDDRLKLLTGGARDLPARQQTLRNTLDWSYSLLPEEEKKVFARLGVFVGGFTLEAAEAVCNPENDIDILECVTTLVDNSLVRQEETSDGEPRFGMLETIHAYALEQLAGSGEMETLQARHASYFVDVILQVGRQLYTDKALYWLNWFERENDNTRATLGWCLATPQGIEMGANLIFALFWFWYRRGYAIEGRIWADRFLAAPALQSPSPLRMIVLASSGMLSLWHGEQEMALARLQESLQIEYRIEDDFMIATLHMANAIAYINMGRDAQAKPLLEQSRALFQETHLVPFVALTTVHLGNVELGLGNPDQARALHEEALGIARAIGESWMISFALNNLGEVARVQGQYELARKYYEECELLLRDTGDQGDMARFVHNLGYIAQHEGDYARAHSQFRESLVMFRRLGNRRGMAECMAGLAGLRARQGEAEWGATMLSAAESVLKITGGAWWPADRVEVEANQEILRAALKQSELAAAQTKGRAMTLEQALAFASEYQ